MIDKHKNSATIYAVVLAAGKSRRFNACKQLAMLDGETLVYRAARLARECCGNNAILVVGYRGIEVAEAAGTQCEYLLNNDHYDDGFGSSIALAARAIHGVADAMLLLLADQPLIDAPHLRRIIDQWSGADNEIVATEFDGTLGPPVLMPATAIVCLRDLTGDRGAKELFNDRRFKLVSVPCADAAIDIDTTSDLERIDQATD